jgi:hypothetical protein
MSSATAFLVGQMIGAGICSAFLAAIKKWRWVPVPFIGLFIIWAIGYWLTVR